MSWLCEDHQQIRSEGNKVTVSDGEQFTKCAPLTALFKPEAGGHEIGRSHWEFRFKLEKNDAYVGFTTEKLFGPGYRSKGLLYGGNLSSGSTLLVPDFGEHIRDEDCVSLLLDTDEASLKIYVYHNQQPLGLAFHLPKPYPKPLFPVVHIFGPGEVTVVQLSDMPHTLERKPVTFTGIEGHWKINKCESNGTLVPESHKWQKYSMDIFMDGTRKFRTAQGGDQAERATYSLRFHLINSIFARLEQYSSDKWSLVPGSATLFGLCGENAKIENFITEFLGKFENLILQDEDLILLGDDDSKIYFNRFSKESPSPVTINPLSQPD